MFLHLLLYWFNPQLWAMIKLWHYKWKIDIFLDILKSKVFRQHLINWQALQRGAVYALRYELFDGLKSMPDINETRSYRHMRPVKSTIGLFVVRRNRLKPVAIQMDYKQGIAVKPASWSTVYLPNPRSKTYSLQRTKPLLNWMKSKSLNDKIH